MKPGYVCLNFVFQPFKRLNITLVCLIPTLLKIPLMYCWGLHSRFDNLSPLIWGWDPGYWWRPLTTTDDMTISVLLMRYFSSYVIGEPKLLMKSINVLLFSAFERSRSLSLSRAGNPGLGYWCYYCHNQPISTLILTTINVWHWLPLTLDANNI